MAKGSFLHIFLSSLFSSKQFKEFEIALLSFYLHCGRDVYRNGSQFRSSQLYENLNENDKRYCISCLFSDSNNFLEVLTDDSFHGKIPIKYFPCTSKNHKIFKHDKPSTYKKFKKQNSTAVLQILEKTDIWNFTIAFIQNGNIMRNSPISVSSSLNSITLHQQTVRIRYGLKGLFCMQEEEKFPRKFGWKLSPFKYVLHWSGELKGKLLELMSVLLSEIQSICCVASS